MTSDQSKILFSEEVLFIEIKKTVLKRYHPAAFRCNTPKPNEWLITMCLQSWMTGEGIQPFGSGVLVAGW